MTKRILRNWKSQLIDSKFRLALYISTITIALVLAVFTSFLQVIENRDGVVIHDPFLNILSPINLTWFTFALIYGGVIIAVIYLINNPKLLVLTFFTYSVLVLLRIFAMYFLPLNPPTDMIALKDPFVDFFGGGKTLTKDLFFSGHTSLMFMLFLIIKEKKLKRMFFYSTFLVGFSVLLQHVHYTIDVIVAPVFAYISYQIGIYLFNRMVNKN